MPKLAIRGGTPVRTTKFPAYLTIGEEEQEAVRRVLHSGVLSRFLGTWHEDFYGGPEVRAFEREWAAYFGAKHAIAVNSATSALYCAVGAAGIGPGDEVIVSPYTMSASSVAPLVYNAIPVFADIEKDFYCLSADTIEARITDRTRAIIVVDLFGQPYDVTRIDSLARRHGLLVIEDCAQAPGAMFGNRYAGTLGDIGIYSLNYHKHIHTGEGGIIVTDSDELADRIRLIRNHAEAVVEQMGVADITNLLGFNYRMTEVEAAVGRQQLIKLETLVTARLQNVEYLSDQLRRIACLEPARIRPDCRHVYYIHALKFDQAIAGVHRDRFVEAVRAELMPTELRETEGVKVGCGYVKPLYLQPLYQKRIAYGKAGCPWSCDRYNRPTDYSRGSCPIAEDLHENLLITHELMRPPMTQRDLDDVVEAFSKVWENRGELQQIREE
jgi:perosamine synthetase